MVETFNYEDIYDISIINAGLKDNGNEDVYDFTQIINLYDKHKSIESSGALIFSVFA